jgi:hypothetical protein
VYYLTGGVTGRTGLEKGGRGSDQNEKKTQTVDFGKDRYVFFF